MSVSVREIDEQHRQLVQMVNSLHHAMVESRGPQEQAAAIQGMVDYAASRFKVEEDYMRRFRYSGFILTLEIVDFLKTWLTDHILGVDQRYKECFSQNGLR